MSDDRQLLFETYKLHAELAQRVDESREGLNKIYAGLVSGIVVASVLLQRFAPNSESMWLFPTLGIVISISWRFSLKSVTDKLLAKHYVLLELEKKIPFDFLTQQHHKFVEKGYLRRKYSGRIMPTAFFLFCAVWLLILLVQYISALHNS